MQKRKKTNLVRNISWLTSMALGLGLTLPVKADMAKVRCDFYPKGEDKATLSTTCSFSQRQGNVGITKPNGARYDFRYADSNQGGVYTDNNNNEVTREIINGGGGLIFRTVQESIYIYWDNNTQSSPSTSP